MTVSQTLRKRINYQRDFEDLLVDVCQQYSLGNFLSFDPIEIGYEDVNLKLATSKGQFFVKVFAESRTDEECLRLVNVVKIAIDNGVLHPKFLLKDTGYIFRGRYDDFNIRLAVFEFIEGENFFELNRKPTESELSQIVKGAAMINKIDYKPKELYDSWALVNFSQELKKSRKYLNAKELKVLDALQTEFEAVNLQNLKYSLVHGDLISTNIMKSKEKIYFVDFSVANYYPRIVELAVLMSNIFFDPNNGKTLEKNYNFLLGEYGKHISLTDVEKKVLPLFVKLAHAMHLVRATREKNEGESTKENEYWLTLGKKGLELSMEVF